MDTQATNPYDAIIRQDWASIEEALRARFPVNSELHRHALGLARMNDPSVTADTLPWNAARILGAQSRRPVLSGATMELLRRMRTIAEHVADPANTEPATPDEADAFRHNTIDVLAVLGGGRPDYHTQDTTPPTIIARIPH